MKVRPQGILVLDYGSQYTLLIARRLREAGFYTEIHPSDHKCPEHFDVRGIILSGGPDSIHKGGRMLAPWVLQSALPVLGICYGMQLLVSELGGEVIEADHREFGGAMMRWEETAAQSFHKDLPEKHQVWMSHGDEVRVDDQVWSVAARTLAGIAAAVVHKSLPVYGLQFHPEVEHTEYGVDLLINFAQNVCLSAKDWSATKWHESISEEIREQVGDGHVLVAVSGGVDSSVMALLLLRALGTERVHAVLVDHGMMRAGEIEHVGALLKEQGLRLTIMEEKDRFFSQLKGVADPEKKRKIIGHAFIECFEEFAKDLPITHLGQGTLYPDVIESAAHGSGAGVIKSHHNVGGLPENLQFELVEPLRFLFKDEVRVVGRELGLPDHMVDRHPFPGPGLGIRIPGEVDEEKANILRAADAIFIQALRDEGYYNQVWQAGVVLLPVKSVGVMGDQRTREWTAVLRAVDAVDAMTAYPSPLSLEFLNQVAGQIVSRVRGVNRVLYDVTSKPPATIEWE
ncbi:MAG: glutamine-hydrolyzing GMP synthase [Oligoflexales bacterium]